MTADMPKCLVDENRMKPMDLAVLTSEQIAALRELSEIWPENHAVIIGATALGFYHDMRWRKTADIDLAVSLEFDDFPGNLRDRPGWQQHPTRAHEFLSPSGVKIDLLPAGERLLEQGQLQWPSGHVMNLVGMELAFMHAERHEVIDDCRVGVAPPAVLTVLKMASYCDRPDERERDLEDIAHLLEFYVDEDSDRRWEEAGDGVEFELAPAYLLGLDIGRLTDDSHRGLIDMFLARVSDPESLPHAVMKQRGPGRWKSIGDALPGRLNAFVTGLYAGAAQAPGGMPGRPGS